MDNKQSMYYTKFDLYAEIDPNQSREYDLQRYDVDTGFKLECTVGVSFTIWIKGKHELKACSELNDIGVSLTPIGIRMTPLCYLRKPLPAIDTTHLSDDEKLLHSYYVKVFDYFRQHYSEKYLLVPNASNDVSTTDKPEGVKVLEVEID